MDRSDIYAKPTGEGRCSRAAARFSPGASNATTGTPKVAPSSDDMAPPKECPGETVNDGEAESTDALTYDPDIRIRVHVGHIVIQILHITSVSDVILDSAYCTHSGKIVKEALFCQSLLQTVGVTLVTARMASADRRPRRPHTSAAAREHQVVVQLVLCHCWTSVASYPPGRGSFDR